MYPAYKSHRPDPPADLTPQFPLMRATVRAFGMIPVEQDAYEADDLIATYARQARAAGADVMIVSADKDLMQLIGPGVSMYDPASGDREERRIGPAEVVDYFGARRRQGGRHPGAGGRFDRQRAGRAGHRRQDRGAADRRIWRPRNAARPRPRDQAAEAPRGVDAAGECRAHPHVEIAGDARPRRAARDAARSARHAEARRQGADRLLQGDGADDHHAARRGNDRRSRSSSVEPDPRFVGPAGWQGKAGEEALAREQAAAGRRPTRRRTHRPPGAPTPADLAAKRLVGSAGADRPLGLPASAQRERDSKPGSPRAFDQGFVAFNVETSTPDPLQAELVGLSLALSAGEAAYVPIGHRNASDDLFDGSGLLPDQIPEEQALALLKPLMEAPGVVKIGQNVKFDLQVLARRGVDGGADRRHDADVLRARRGRDRREP